MRCGSGRAALCRMTRRTTVSGEWIDRAPSPGVTGYGDSIKERLLRERWVHARWTQPAPLPHVTERYAATLAPIGVFGHWSSQLRTPSRSWSLALPPHENCTPMVLAMWWLNSVALSSRNITSRTCRRR